MPHSSPHRYSTDRGLEPPIRAAAHSVLSSVSGRVLDLEAALRPTSCCYGNITGESFCQGTAGGTFPVNHHVGSVSFGSELACEKNVQFMETFAVLSSHLLPSACPVTLMHCWPLVTKEGAVETRPQGAHLSQLAAGVGSKVSEWLLCHVRMGLCSPY